MTFHFLAPFFLVVLTMTSPPAQSACPPLLNRTLGTLTGDTKKLCEFQGKVLLVVNTASKCGFTPQYKGLEALYKKYKDQGFAVLGFPSNDFGAQEPGSGQDVAKFCELNFGVSFPMFEKTPVRDAGKNDFYDLLATATGERPQWNFHKYLIDRKGNVVKSFASDVTPDAASLVTQIETMLTQKP